MHNVGDEPFTHDMFKQAYDSDPKIQNIVADFDQRKISIKSGDETGLNTKPAADKNTVSTMAKRATKLGN